MENELKHYGVKGMRWGIKRAKKQMSNPSTRDKAMKTLSTHRSKVTKKLTKLEKQHASLTKYENRYAEKTAVRTSKMRTKAAKYKIKAGGFFTSGAKAAKYMQKANKLEGRATLWEANHAKRKAKLHKNERLQEAFKTGLNEIDDMTLNAGKDWIYETIDK